MVSDLTKGLPLQEQKVYQQMITLSKEEKKTLWNIIRQVTKDGVVVLPKTNWRVQSLVNKQLLVENPAFTGSGTSLKVLPHAPYLLRKLQKL